MAMPFCALVFSNSNYETNFVVSSAEGAGNNKIGFIIRIAAWYYDYNLRF